MHKVIFRNLDFFLCIRRLSSNNAEVFPFLVYLPLQLEWNSINETDYTNEKKDDKGNTN